VRPPRLLAGMGGATALSRRRWPAHGDLARFGSFEDEWLRGGPVQRWIPKGLAGRPVCVFETGGSTGVPKSRISIDDFRTDDEMFSATLPDEFFPIGRGLAARGA